jgi:hypothetical protein
MEHPKTLPDARWLWDVVERSQGGHERRFRLSSRMTEDEAAAHAAEHGLQLERVEDSTSRRAYAR